jgi:hypothetical protein
LVTATKFVTTISWSRTRSSVHGESFGTSPQEKSVQDESMTNEGTLRS